MKRSTPHVALGIVLAVAGSMAQTARAQTNEIWGGQGGASSWQTGSAKPTGAVAGRIATGADSTWGAGKGSVATRGSLGGVWSDGSTFHASAVQAPGGRTGAGVSSLIKPVGPSSFGAVPSRSHVGVTTSRGRPAGRPGESHAGAGMKGTSGPQFGSKKIGGISRRSSRGRPGATTMRGQLGTSSRSGSTASGQGLGSPMASDPALQGLTGSTSSPTLSLEPQPSLGSSSH